MTNEQVTLDIPADYFQSAESREYVTKQFQRAISNAFEAGKRAVEPPASEGALKCPTCKRPFEEVAISELREYFEPPAPQEKFPGAARNAEEMKIYQSGYDHGFRDGEQSASGNRPCSGEGS
jgi:hypothetical protein